MIKRILRDSVSPWWMLFTLLCAAAAQTSAPTITVLDENGVAVASARITLQAPPQPPSHCQTDYTGRCRFPGLAAGQYEFRVEKEGFYALAQPALQLTPASNIDVTISHQQEVRKIVNVQESAPAIDPAQVSSQETLTGLDVINMR